MPQSWDPDSLGLRSLYQVAGSRSFECHKSAVDGHIHNHKLAGVQLKSSERERIIYELTMNYSFNILTGISLRWSWISLTGRILIGSLLRSAIIVALSWRRVCR